MQKSFRGEDSREIRLISDAVINLYAAHVNSLLYTYDNPLITDSLKNAYHCLQKAFRRKPCINLGTAGGRVVIDSELLEGDGLILQNFASWLNSRNIKSVSFSDGLTRRELTSFHKIISINKINGDELYRSMSEKSITNIVVLQTDPQLDGDPGPSDLAGSADRVLLKDGAETMFHMDGNQAQSVFFSKPSGTSGLADSDAGGLCDDYVSTMFQSDNNPDKPLFVADPPWLDPTCERIDEDQSALYVEMLVEGKASEDVKRAARGIPPDRMADILNAMFPVTPADDVLAKIGGVYTDESSSAHAGHSPEKQRVFLEMLKPSLRDPLLKSYPSPSTTGDQPAEIDPTGRPGALREVNPARLEAEAEGSDIYAPNSRLIRRTLECSDFVFDFIAHDKAVLHDIELDGNTPALFSSGNFTRMKQGSSQDRHSFSINPAKGGALSARHIYECSEEVILATYYDIVLELVQSDSIEGEEYQKLQGRLASLIDFSLGKGDFERVLDVYNALKTQSLQGRFGLQASWMIGNIFSSDQFNGKAVEALNRYGRKKREYAGKFAAALRSYLVPYLLDALGEEPNTSKRKFMIMLLTSVKSDILPHIVRRLRDSRWYVSRNMLYLLRECHGRSYASEVKGFLEHEVPIVRLEALKTLLSFHDRDADQYVRKFLKSDIFELQKGAVLLAGVYRIKSAVPHLLGLLMEKDIMGKKFLFKKTIVLALGRIGDGHAVGRLLTLCRSTSVVHKGYFDRLKIEIFKTLHNYPMATVGPLLNCGMHLPDKEINATCRKLMVRYNLHHGRESRV